jgi:hypothetical protein
MTSRRLARPTASLRRWDGNFVGLVHKRPNTRLTQPVTIHAREITHAPQHRLAERPFRPSRYGLVASDHVWSVPRVCAVGTHRRRHTECSASSIEVFVPSATILRADDELDGLL